MPTIIMEEGPHRGKRIVFEDRAVLGRLAAVEISLAGDDKVSRRHARVYKAGNGFAIVDLGSANGTFVNDVKVESKTPLKTGDRIRVGLSLMQFVEAAGGEARPEPAAAGPARSKATAAPAADRPEDVEIEWAGATPDREPEPAARKTPPSSASVEPLQLRDAPLQYSKYKDADDASLLKDDLGQRSALYRILVIVGVMALGAALTWAVYTLTVGLAQ